MGGRGVWLFLLGIMGHPIILGGTPGQVVGAVNKSASGGSGPGGGYGYYRWMALALV